jgi:hypothetical protein
MEIPVDVVLELRGVAPASQFVARDTGEQVEVPAKAKFEFELPDGNVGNLELSSTQLQKASGDFDFNTAERGDQVRVVGVTRNGERGAYLQVLTVERVGS